MGALPADILLLQCAAFAKNHSRIRNMLSMDLKQLSRLVRGNRFTPVTEAVICGNILAVVKHCTGKYSGLHLRTHGKSLRFWY